MPGWMLLEVAGGGGGVRALIFAPAPHHPISLTNLGGAMVKTARGWVIALPGDRVVRVGDHLLVENDEARLRARLLERAMWMEGVDNEGLWP